MTGKHDYLKGFWKNIIKMMNLQGFKGENMLSKKDRDFVKEIKEHLDNYINRHDIVELEYVQQMINDWVIEIEKQEK